MEKRYIPIVFLVALSLLCPPSMTQQETACKTTPFLTHVPDVSFDYESVCALSDYSIKSYIARRKKAMHNVSGRAAPWIASILRDAVTLHTNLFSFETAMLGAFIIPAVIATRTLDNKIQSCFYDETCHKNRCQPPQWITEFARVINAPTIAILALRGFFTHDQEFTLTSRAMLISLPFLIYVNQAIKNFKCDMSLRPWHQDFSREKQASGGFPSGHVSKATYLAVLYGSRFGYKFAIPLSMFAAFTSICFIASNRHYTSQVIAGVGFGAAYALAASTLVDMQLRKKNDLSIDLALNDYGMPAVSLSYRF